MTISPYSYPGTFRKIPVPTVREMKPLLPAQIVEVVCDYYRLDPTDKMTRKSRVGKYVKARHMSWLYIRKYCVDVSLRDCGFLFGNYDHTTVIHGLQTIQNRIDTNPSIKFEAMQLELIVKTLDNPNPI